MRGQSSGPLKNAVFHEYDYRNSVTKGDGLDPDRCLAWMVRDEAHKYIQFADPGMPPLLFDLRQDPGEHINLAGRAGHQATVAAYCQRLLRWRMQNEDQRMEHWAAQYRKR